MNTAKRGAINRAIINVSMESFNAWRKRNNIATEIIMELGRIISKIGCDAEGYVDKVKSYFIEHVDAHTTIILPTIIDTVNASNHDFIKGDWDVIFSDLFPNTQKYDHVVYSVDDTLFFNFEDAIKIKTSDSIIEKKPVM
jgi:hypothetical protein